MPIMEEQPVGEWTDSSGDTHPIYAAPSCGDTARCHAEPPACGCPDQPAAPVLAASTQQWYSRCSMHNCDEPIRFTQAVGEAPGVGRWGHTAPALDYSAATGRGHLARP